MNNIKHILFPLLLIILLLCFYLLIPRQIEELLDKALKDFNTSRIILASFCTAVLAFMIPAGINIISKIQERFPRKEVEDKFKNEITFKYLPALLIIQILLLIIFGFVFEALKVFLLVAILLLPLIIFSLTYEYIKILIKYSNKENVTELIVEDINTYIKKGELKKGLDLLNFLTNFLVMEIKHNDIDYINNLKKEIKKFVDIFVDKDYEYFKELGKGIKDITIKATQTEDNSLILHLLKLIEKPISTSISKNDEEKLRYLLEINNEIFFDLIEENNKYKYSFSIYWYFSAYLFSFEKKKLNNNFLSMLDKEMFKNIKYLINNDQIDIFKSIIDSFYSDGSAYKLYNVSFNNDGLDNNDKEKLLKNLKNMFFGVALYCLFKDKYDYISLIFKSAHKGSFRFYYIYPGSINELINFLKFSQTIYNDKQKFSFIEICEKKGIREGIRDSKNYYEQYYLYLLGYLIYRDNEKGENEFLKDKDNESIFYFDSNIKGFEEKIDEVYDNKNLDIFKKFGFKDIDEEKLEELKKKVKEHFKSLKKEIALFISKADLDKDKIEKFKEKILKDNNLQKFNGNKESLKNKEPIYSSNLDRKRFMKNISFDTSFSGDTLMDLTKDNKNGHYLINFIDTKDLSDDELEKHLHSTVNENKKEEEILKLKKEVIFQVYKT